MAIFRFYMEISNESYEMFVDSAMNTYFEEQFNTTLLDYIAWFKPCAVSTLNRTSTRRRPPLTKIVSTPSPPRAPSNSSEICTSGCWSTQRAQYCPIANVVFIINKSFDVYLLLSPSRVRYSPMRPPTIKSCWCEDQLCIFRYSLASLL